MATPKDQSPKAQELRAKLASLGIKHHWNAGADKLEALLQEHHAAEAKVDAERFEGLDSNQQGEIDPTPFAMSEEEYKRKMGITPQKEANRLIRCRIQCMDPAKSEVHGEIISVGSAKLGTFKKFVPFHSDQPYHLPKIIFDELKEKMCSTFYTETNKLGHKVRKSRQMKAFALTELPPLTPKELKDLAQRQAMADGKDAA